MKLQSQQGYTLLELLVTIVIIGIMVGIFVGSYSYGSAYENVKSQSEKLVSVLRNVRNRAFSGITFMSSTSGECNLGKCDDSSPPSALCTADTECADNTCVFVSCVSNSDCAAVNLGHCSYVRYPIGGYGLYITPTSYLIFADMNGTQSDDSAGPPFYDGESETVEAFTISSNVSIRINNDPKITAAEIIFDGTDVAIYEYKGSWSGPFEADDAYFFQTRSSDGLCVRDSQGQVTLNIDPVRLDQEIVDCP